MMVNVVVMIRLQGVMREGGEEELGAAAAAARRGEEGEEDDPPRTVAQARLQRKCVECHCHVAAIHDM